MNTTEIDFVLPWVDGSDDSWYEEKCRYQGIEEGLTEWESGSIRYRSWDNLRYWFRGVEKFAPWVHRIHFVTWGHIPDWLDVNNSKLHIVKHEDYIPEKYLPTFSANPIELNFHRIEGIANQFVYFNDDMFLLRPVKPEDFFKNGLPRDTAALNALSLPPYATTLLTVNNTAVINRNFSKKKTLIENPLKWFNPLYGKDVLRTVCLLPWPRFTGFREPHLPDSFLLRTYEEVWEKEPEVLEETCMHRFRNAKDVTQWLMRDWQLVKGDFVPRSHRIGKVYSKPIDDEIISCISKGKYKMVCINDCTENDSFEIERDRLNEAFSCLLPDKSTFEI